SYVEEKLILRVPSNFFAEWLESHFKETIMKAVKKIYGHRSQIEYLEATGLDNEPDNISFADSGNTKERPEAAKEDEREDTNHLDIRFTFDNFLAENDNELAFRAAQIVAEQPGKTDYNPLFIYGSCGCGKSHLLNSVGNYIQKTKKRKKVAYLSAENFLNEYIYALRNNNIDAFNKTILKYDVFLLDDFNILSNKKKSQEGLFFLMAEFERRRKQVVVTANEAPAHLKGLENRLLNFFQKGLIVDLIYPGRNTRLNWIEQFCVKNNLAVLPEVKQLVCESLHEGFHQTRAAMIRIDAQTSLLGKPVSISKAKKVLSQIDSNWAKQNNGYQQLRSLKIPDIIKVVSDYLQVPADIMLSYSRQREVSQARQVAIYFCRELSGESYQTIGYHFQDRHYTAIIHSYKKIQKELKKNPGLMHMISEIKAIMMKSAH
ncbi:MAG: DnaA/Hda family protein, partial [Calditrichia bacterium]